VVDINKEHIAVREATKLGIPVIALTDTNSDPTLIDYPIPSNDDSYPAISVLIKALASGIEEGLAMREQDRELETTIQDKEVEESKPTRPRRAERIASTVPSSDSGIEYKHTSKKVEPTNMPKAANMANKPFKRAQEPAFKKESNMATPKKATATFSKSAKPSVTAKPSTNFKEAGQESSFKNATSKREEKNAQPEVDAKKEETK
jgi:small subunit ribosomal protein S2